MLQLPVYIIGALLGVIFHEHGQQIKSLHSTPSHSSVLNPFFSLLSSAWLRFFLKSFFIDYFLLRILEPFTVLKQ